MTLLQRLSRSHPDDPGRELDHHIDQALEAAVGRYEPIALEAHSLPVDPYMAWLAQHEGALEREDGSRIRWVYRHRGSPAAISNPKV
jgi:hypothetical protein